LWSFTFASKKYHPVHDFDEQRVAASGLDFQYYNQALHSTVCALPNFVKKALAGLINDSLLFFYIS
jgi:spermidine synthase